MAMKDEIRKKISKAISAIPKGHVTDPVIKETIRCVLYGYLWEQGLTPIPAFRNPRFPEGPVDIVGMADFCSNPTIELADIKSLERVVCEKKFVITFSLNRKKVQMSTFFLKPGIEHIYIYGTEG